MAQNIHIHRNASYEVQKTLAMSVMGTAITTWGSSINEECMSSSFFVPESLAILDGVSNEAFTEELSS